jgi:hypothetical protein
LAFFEESDVLLIKYRRPKNLEKGGHRMSKYNREWVRKATGGRLLRELRELLAAHRSAFKQERTFVRGEALVLADVMAFGRKTMTQRLISLGATEQDWSGWYRLLSVPRIDQEELSRCLTRATFPHVPVEEPYVAVVDGVGVPRSSRRMPGTAWRRCPRTPVFRLGIDRAQRFVNLAWLTPRQDGYSRAIPLRWWPAFPPKAVASPEPPRKEWEAGLAGLCWLRQQLDEAGRQEQWLLGVGDGSYDVKRIWPGLPSRTTLTVRGAKNRALYHLPEAQTGRGRRRKYGPRARRPDQWLKEKQGWHQRWVQIRGRRVRLRYRVEGPFVARGAPEQPVMLLVVGGLRVKKAGRKPYWKPPTFWLISARERKGQWELPLPVQEILQWLWQRWEIEVAHREMKSGFGVGQMQCWSPHGAIGSVTWAAWVYAVLVLAGYRAWGLVNGTVHPPGRWWRGARRWSFDSLWRGYRQELWGLKEFQPLWSGITSKLWKNELWWAGLGNAVAGSLRI